jgi:hypothetical protein
MTLPGNFGQVITNYINAGKIIAYLGAGTVNVLVDEVVGVETNTIVTATAPVVVPTAVWIPANNTNNTDGLWADGDNWDGGVIPTADTDAILNVPGTIPCKVTSFASAARIVSDTSGAGGTLIVTNVATLSVGAANSSIIGENQAGMLVVESGGSATFGNTLHIGYSFGSVGGLTINGGTVSVAGELALGYGGGTGTVNVNGGTLNIAQWNAGSIGYGASKLDVAGSGKVVINGYAVDTVEYYVNLGAITANGGTNVFYSWDGNLDKTTIAAEYIAPAQTVWNPAANPAGDGLWSNPTNWTQGLPGNVPPTESTKTVFNVADATNCVVNIPNASAGRIVMGDNGPGGTLIVTNGGILTVGGASWSAINYNDTSSTATLIVGSGGAASFGYHLWIGHQSNTVGVLIMNGGTVSVGQQFGLGFSGGTGTALIKAGTLNLFQIAYPQSISATSVLDVSGTGQVLINGNRLGEIGSFVADGKITSNGGPNVIYYYDSVADKTVITTVPIAKEITDITVAGGVVTLTYGTFAGVTYHVESTPSLATVPIVWTPVAGTTTNAAGSSVTSSFPVGSSPESFYRSVSP